MAATQTAPKKSIDYISTFLQTGGILKKFTFPRIHLPNIAGYKPEYYADIGRRIAKGEIEVVLAQGSIEGAKAFYEIDGTPRLNLTEATRDLNTPEHWSTIVHEATHMIQDMKRWRMTLQEMEADAHFAQALFLYYKNVKSSSSYMFEFERAAKAFAENELKEFRSRCAKMKAAISNKYDGENGYEDLYEKRRMNGI